MSLAPGKSDLKKHLSRHIHVEKASHPVTPASLPDGVDSSTDPVDPTAAALPALQPVVRITWERCPPE
jgi:hypothetical protein